MDTALPEPDGGCSGEPSCRYWVATRLRFLLHCPLSGDTHITRSLRVMIIYVLYKKKKKLLGRLSFGLAESFALDLVARAGL